MDHTSPMRELMRTTGSLISLLQISSLTNLLAWLVVACCLAHGGCSPLHIHSQLLWWVELESWCENEGQPSYLPCILNVDHHSQKRGLPQSWRDMAMFYFIHSFAFTLHMTPQNVHVDCSPFPLFPWDVSMSEALSSGVHVGTLTLRKTT